VPRRFLYRVLPGHERIAQQRLPITLVSLLGDSRLWHFGRRSVMRGAGVGMFIAFIPLPFQMVLVVMASVWLRVNLPVAFAAIFITNPLTMVPVFYLNYRLGAWMLGTPALEHLETLSLDRATELLGQVWLPLCTGSLVIATCAGFGGMLLTDQLWKFFILWKRRRRKQNKHV
jgi:uncharacterized protein (DUF2062 family)